jgi:hypothetical protein
MREIRLYGSEGGVAFGPSLPLSRLRQSRSEFFVPLRARD